MFAIALRATDLRGPVATLDFEASGLSSPLLLTVEDGSLTVTNRSSHAIARALLIYSHPGGGGRDRDRFARSGAYGHDSRPERATRKRVGGCVVGTRSEARHPRQQCRRGVGRGIRAVSRKAGGTRCWISTSRRPFFLTQQASRAAQGGGERGAARQGDQHRLGRRAQDSTRGRPIPTRASKAGLIHLTKRMAARLIADNIVVSAIAPGAFPSSMNKAARDAEELVAKTVPGRPGGHVRRTWRPRRSTWQARPGITWSARRSRSMAAWSTPHWRWIGATPSGPA